MDIDHARSVADQLSSAVGDNDRMWDATERLMAASGMPHRDDTVGQMNALRSEGSDFTTRPWRWLMGVASRANETGAYDVPAMIYHWATTWIYDVEPNITGNALVQVGFGKAPPGTYAELVRQAEIATRKLAPDFVVVRTAQGDVISSGAMATVIAEQLKGGTDLSVQAAMLRIALRMRSERET